MGDTATYRCNRIYMIHIPIWVGAFSAGAFEFHSLLAWSSRKRLRQGQQKDRVCAAYHIEESQRIDGELRQWVGGGLINGDDTSKINTPEYDITDINIY